MKKLLLITLSCLMILSLAACGKSNEEGTVGEADGQQASELVKNDKKEQECTLENEYNFEGFCNVYFEKDGKFRRTMQYFDGLDSKEAEQTGTYKKDKNVINVTLSDGSKLVYRLFENALVNITEDVYKADMAVLTNAENPVPFHELRKVDLKSLKDGTKLRNSSNCFLYYKGYIFQQFDLSYAEFSYDTVSLDDFNIADNGNSLQGKWDDDWASGMTNRYATFAQYNDAYKNELEFAIKLANYIEKYKDVNPRCFRQYYTTRDSKYTYNHLKEIIGALYWTIGEFDKAKASFASYYDRDTYISFKYRRDVQLNEYNVITHDPNMPNNGYVTDANGFVIEEKDRNKTIKYLYDSEGRLTYKWDNEGTCYKYEYNGTSFTVYSYYVDRYGKGYHSSQSGTIVGMNPEYSTSTGNEAGRPGWLGEIPDKIPGK